MKGHSTKDPSDNGGEIIVDGIKITEKDYIEHIYPKLKSELEKKNFKIIDDIQKEKYRIELGDKQFDEKEYVKKILENDVKIINMERKVKGFPPLPFSIIIIHTDKRNKPGTHIYCKSGDKAGSAELAEKIAESLNNKAKTDQKINKASLMQNTNAIERKKVFMNALSELNILFSFIESFNLPDESERLMFKTESFLEIWSEAIANGVKKFHEEKR